jgi:hypothetical protein
LPPWGEGARFPRGGRGLHVETTGTGAAFLGSTAKAPDPLAVKTTGNKTIADPRYTSKKAVSLKLYSNTMSRNAAPNVLQSYSTSKTRRIAVQKLNRNATRRMIPTNPSCRYTSK